MNIFKVCLFNRDKKIWRLYDDGQKRMEKEFDVVKIIKSLRNIKIFLKNEKLDKETKILLQNQKGM